MAPFKILLVDDSVVFVRAAKQFIEEAFRGDSRLQVLATAGSGDEALRRMDAESPDLVLMDVRMPGLDGIEATRRIKLLAQPPTVLMLSLEDEGLERAAELAGADGYMSKSALVEQLPVLIGALLDEEAK
jgi:CheY-like chemotaxis protein